MVLIRILGNLRINGTNNFSCRYGSGSLECRVVEFAVAGFKKLDTKSEGTAHFTSPFGDFLLDPFSFAQEP